MMGAVVVMRELARRRLNLPTPDLRSPEERMRDNEKLVQRLKGRLPAQLHVRLADAIVGRDVAWGSLERALGKESFLDVCEALVLMEMEA